MSKRYFFTFLIILVAVLSLGRIDTARAMDGPDYYPFNAVQSDRLYASASSACPDTHQDSAAYHYELEITPEILANIQETVFADGVIVVEFSSVSRVTTAGTGEAAVRAQLMVIVEHDGGGYSVVDGKDTPAVFRPGDRTLVDGTIIFGDPGDRVRVVNVALPVGQLAAGDTIVVSGVAEASARSLSCEPGDQALVSWDLAGSEAGYPDQPVLKLRAD